MGLKRCFGLIGLLLSLAWASPVFASDYLMSFHTGASLNTTSASMGFEGGVRLEEYGLLGKVDWNPWLNTQQLKDTFQAGVLNLGVGGEYRFFGDRCRTSLFVGTSTLLFETALDAKGTTGFFLEYTPVSVRWPLGDRLTLRADPASIHLIVPVLSGIPLISFQYRHGVAIEWSL